MKKSKNKYEDLVILDLNERTDIKELFFDELECADHTVGIVSDRFLIEYLLDEVIDLDYTSINYIDLAPDRIEDVFIMYVTAEGYITVTPLDDDGHLYRQETVFIDMDGMVTQSVIDLCVNEDKDIRLFGLYDAPVKCPCCDCDNGHKKFHICKDSEGKCHGFYGSSNGDDYSESYSYYSNQELSENDIVRILRTLWM